MISLSHKYMIIGDLGLYQRHGKKPWTIPINAASITGAVRTTGSSNYVTFDWGDGTSNTYAGTTDQAFSHTYTVSGEYRIRALNEAVLTSFRITSNSNAQFATKTLPRMLSIFYCYTTNSTLTGDIAGAPAGLTTLSCSNTNSTLTGDIAGAPAGLTTLNYSTTNSTLTGDIAGAPAGLISLSCYTTNSTFTGYTPGRTWAASMNVIRNYGTNSTLNSTDNDNLLIDLAMTTWAGTKAIGLKGSRTSASDAAVATLVATGVAVTMYP